VLLLAAAPAAALLPPLPAAAALVADVLLELFVLGVLGREGGVMSVLGAAVMIAGDVAVVVAAVLFVLAGLAVLACEVLALGAGGSVSGAHAGASRNNKPTNRQHTFRIQRSFSVRTRLRKHRIAALAAAKRCCCLPRSGRFEVCKIEKVHQR
jgi:hypothetical protein